MSKETDGTLSRRRRRTNNASMAMGANASGNKKPTKMITSSRLATDYNVTNPSFQQRSMLSVPSQTLRTMMKGVANIHTTRGSGLPAG